MTTVSQIITDAYQYNNLVALSAIPNADEQAKALRYLNRLFRSIFGNELGDQLKSWDIGNRSLPTGTLNDYENRLTAPYYIPHNARLILNLEAASTIYLPAHPQDGERLAIQDIGQNLATYNLTVNANGRLIEFFASMVLDTNGTNSEWFFRADLGTWIKLSELALTDTFPLPTEFEEFFIILLAMRLGASEGVDLNAQLSYVLKDTTKKIKSRYKQITEVGPELGLVRTSRTSRNYSNSVRFNNG